MSNENNLIPFSGMSPEEAREIQSAGGRALKGIGEKRRTIRDIAKALLSEVSASDGIGEGENRYLMLARQVKKAVDKGDLDSAKWVLDMAGETPKPQDEIPTEVEEVHIIPKIAAFLSYQKAIDSNAAFVYGTTRSGKTYGILQWLVEQLRTGSITGQILVGGQTVPFLKNGACYYLKAICANLPDVQIKDDGKEIVHNNGVIKCQSFDDPSKALSGQWSAVYLNEGNYITQEVADALRIRNGGLMIVDYNPSLSQWWGKSLQTPTNELFCKFSDNPYLSDSQLAAIESIRVRGENAPAGSYDNWYYNVYYLGRYSEMGGGVFTKCYRTQPSEMEQAEGVEVHGIDFGDVTDPNALVAVKVDVPNEVVWVRCLYYQTATDDVTMVQVLNDNGIERLVCETATGGQTRMKNFKRLGFKGMVIGCEKERVSQSVFNLTRFRINCCDDTSYNEFSGYRINDGRFEGADHCIDAVRYVAHLILTNKIR